MGENMAGDGPSVQNGGRFRDKCAYCFADCYTQYLSVCQCRLSLCDSHAPLHCPKTGCSILYSVRVEKAPEAEADSKRIGTADSAGAGSPNVLVRGTENTGEMAKIAKMVRESLEYGGGASLDADGAVCPHLADSNNTDTKTDDVTRSDDDSGVLLIKEEDEKCKQCEVTGNLWLCMACGAIGCGRKQAGKNGNGHAMDHFRESGHIRSVYISSLNSTSPELFCYACDDFVSNYRRNPPIMTVDGRAVRVKRESGSAERFLCDRQEPQAPAQSIRSKFVGIKNHGETCYISSVLQLLAVALRDSELSVHFELCAENPLDCLCCQFVRILNKLRQGPATKEDGDDTEDGDNSSGGGAIEISDFLRIVYATMSGFPRGKQSDCVEFLQTLLMHLSFFEESGLLPRVTETFLFCVETVIQCAHCARETKDGRAGSSTRTVRTEDEKILYVQHDRELDRAVNGYFRESVLGCDECGSDDGKRMVVRMKKQPERLLVAVKRQKWDEKSGQIQKIGDSIEGTAVRLGQREFVFRTGICHVGSSVEAGHYTCLVREESADSTGLYYLISDESVSVSSPDQTAHSTIFLME